MSGAAPDTLALVSRDHPLTASPDPEDLVPVHPRFPHILLHIRAQIMLERLLSAVGGAGEIVPVSGFRSQAEQQAIWDQSTRDHGPAFTASYVARPGCSEHQTVLAIDLAENQPEIDFLCPSFPDRGVCREFGRRAAEFGFILRYPRHKEHITGISWEPWHFRYVGWPHAILMEERDLTLEEYTQWLSRCPEEGEHLRCQAAGRSFELYHVPRSRLEGLESRLPAGVPHQCSGNNVDGAVVTLWRSIP